MANREVNLTKRVQTPHGWRYCRVVLSPNGRVRPDLVIVNGKQETHKEGAYYLEWREGAKRVRLSVGKDPADASARRLRKEAELNAVNNGVSVVPEGQNGNRSVAAAVAEFLDETKLTKKPKTLAAYSTFSLYGAMVELPPRSRSGAIYSCSAPAILAARILHNAMI